MSWHAGENTVNESVVPLTGNVNESLNESGFWAETKLRIALDLPALVKERGADFGLIAYSAASSYLQRVCRLEGEYDPELYCCSEVSSNDSEDEF